MKKVINNYKELENKTISLTINRKKFYGSFYLEGCNLFLKINMTKDINEWRKTCNNFDCISGYFIENKEKISLLNCIYSGHSSTGYNPIINATVDYFIDRVILGYKIKKYNKKIIEGVSVEYSNLSWLTKQKVYNYDALKNDISIKSFQKSYKINDKNITFNILPSVKKSLNNVFIETTKLFDFEFYQKKKIGDVIDYIYIVLGIF